jgi:hypothetical protein
VQIRYVEDSRHRLRRYCATTMSASLVARSRAISLNP